MMRMLVLASILVWGCKGGGNNNGDDTGDDQPMIDAPIVIPDSPPPPPGYTKLIGRTWIVPRTAPRPDQYKCVRVTVPQDMYITNIMAQAPTGTHHTVLSLATGIASGPDGEYDCSVMTLGMVMLYASGVGTSPLNFPADVGLKIAAGTKIHLNLHLFNATDNDLAGDSAILVKSQPTPTPILAEMVFAGTFNIDIPMMSTAMASGGCTAQSNYTLFALWPHMHQLATHQKVELTRSGTTTALHDKTFQFAEQSYYLQTPAVQVQTGDRLRVTCTYVNPTMNHVGFGDSSNQEMCFSGLYRYPATGGNLFACTDLPI